jgi:hypothetical protein
VELCDVGRCTCLTQWQGYGRVISLPEKGFFMAVSNSFRWRSHEKSTCKILTRGGGFRTANENPFSLAVA